MKITGENVKSKIEIMQYTFTDLKTKAGCKSGSKSEKCAYIELYTKLIFSRFIIILTSYSLLKVSVLH